MSAAIPRFLLPGLPVPSKRNPRPLIFAVAHRGSQCRNAATNSNSSKPRVLEKPTKFYPPSHPQRLAKRALPRQYPGPPLSQAQQEEQKTKKYPHMMPAEGTVMFWFLNSRMLHMGICLSVLLSLSVFVFVENFHRSTPFVDKLPPGREFWSHPFQFIRTYGQVYKIHTDHVSAETAERRKKKVDDVQKRSRYRKAHGLEDEQGLGGWTAKNDADSLGPSIPTGDLPGDEASPQAPSDKPTHADFEGRSRPVKRWLGIWE
ncbi:MAG: hypothetical protein L6R36_007027 [Xanthoria steineri]|nr:MAG: hypothetical protein L6R36_007027 [Xanthoria steineri]